MTADEIIRSGLLEAYALGQLQGEEAAMVQHAVQADARVRAELDAVEAALEQQAMAHAIAPPPALKQRVLQAVQARKPASSLGAPRPGTSGTTTWRWLAAAAVVAFLASAVLNVMTLGELREVRGTLARMESERAVLAERLQVQEAGLKSSQQQLAVMTDPRTDVVLLKGTPNADGARARVYWDRAHGRVYMDVLQLPEPPHGGQYQLWALVDGKPVDAGVFAMGDAATTLQAMKEVNAAQAFAVTLEKAGGSPTPTLSAMVLLGQV